MRFRIILQDKHIWEQYTLLQYPSATFNDYQGLFKHLNWFYLYFHLFLSISTSLSALFSAVVADLFFTDERMYTCRVSDKHPARAANMSSNLHEHRSQI